MLTSTAVGSYKQDFQTQLHPTETTGPSSGARREMHFYSDMDTYIIAEQRSKVLTNVPYGEKHMKA